MGIMPSVPAAFLLPNFLNAVCNMVSEYIVGPFGIDTTSWVEESLCSDFALVYKEFGKRVSRITFIDSSGDFVS